MLVPAVVNDVLCLLLASCRDVGAQTRRSQPASALLARGELEPILTYGDSIRRILSRLDMMVSSPDRELCSLFESPAEVRRNL